MDVSFPPGFPTLVGDQLTVNRFLASPLLIQRALRTMTQQRFIADVIFQGRANPTGGSILYEQNESIFPDQPVEAVEPGADFPLTTTSRGPGKMANVRKWGLDSEVTLEATMRYLMDPVNRALTKMANGVVRQVDSVALSSLLAPGSGIQTLVGSSWAAATYTSPLIVQLIAQAKASIVGLNQGYLPDTLLINDDTMVNMIANQQMALMLRREDAANPIYTGQLPKILGLDPMVTNNVAGLADGLGQGNMKALVLDRKVLGGMADELPLSSQSWWLPNPEKWRLRAKRVTTPWVMEPAACVQIIGI